MVWMPGCRLLELLEFPDKDGTSQYRSDPIEYQAA